MMNLLFALKSFEPKITEIDIYIWWHQGSVTSLWTLVSIRWSFLGWSGWLRFFLLEREPEIYIAIKNMHGLWFLGLFLNAKRDIKIIGAITFYWIQTRSCFFVNLWSRWRSIIVAGAVTILAAAPKPWSEGRRCLCSNAQREYKGNTCFPCHLSGSPREDPGTSPQFLAFLSKQML